VLNVEFVTRRRHLGPGGGRTVGHRTERYNPTNRRTMTSISKSWTTIVRLSRSMAQGACAPPLKALPVSCYARSTRTETGRSPHE
jgi:hypothetical protein